MDTREVILNSRGDEQLPSVTTTVKEDKVRAMPVAVEQQEPSHADIYKSVTRKPDGDKVDDKRERRDKVIAAVGDGISALANLYYTTKGANSSYGGNTLSEGVKKRYDEIKEERDRRQAETDGYNSGLINAIYRDKAAAARVREQLRGIAAKAAEAEAKRAAEAQKAAADREERQAKAAKEEERWTKKFKIEQKKANAYIANKIQSDNNKDDDKNMMYISLGPGKGNVKLPKSAVNTQTVAVLYNMLPDDIKQQYKGKPQYDKLGRLVGHDNLTDKQMLQAIGYHAGDYPQLRDAIRELAGQITTKEKIDY